MCLSNCQGQKNCTTYCILYLNDYSRPWALSIHVCTLKQHSMSTCRQNKHKQRHFVEAEKCYLKLRIARSHVVECASQSYPIKRVLCVKSHHNSAWSFCQVFVVPNFIELYKFISSWGCPPKLKIRV